MLRFHDPEIQQAKQPITAFTAPDAYIGLPAFWEALHSYAWNLEAGERAQKLMAGASEVLWQPDAIDRIEAAGFPLMKDWLNDMELYVLAHRRVAASWKAYRKGMKGQSK